MSAVFSLNGISLPDLIRTQLANHLARLERVEELHALELAQERAEGFVEGIEATRALTPATIEALEVGRSGFGQGGFFLPWKSKG